MKNNLATCLKFTFQWEGGYTDDPRDPGGATNHGITLQTLQDWRKAPVTPADVQAMTLGEAEAIYAAHYWAPVHGDDLTAGLDLMVFDYGVNTGPARSARVLQNVIGVKTDGFIGPATLAAIAKEDIGALISEVAAMQRSVYRATNNFERYGRGWINRTNAREQAALAMVGKIG